MCFLSSNVLLRFCRGRIDRKSMTCTRCRGLIDGCFRLFDIVLTRTFFAAGCAGIYIYIYIHIHVISILQDHHRVWSYILINDYYHVLPGHYLLVADFVFFKVISPCKVSCMLARLTFWPPAKLSAPKQMREFLPCVNERSWPWRWHSCSTLSVPIGPDHRSRREEKNPRQKICRDLFSGWKKAEKNNDFLVASGSDEFENLLFHCKIVIKKLASAGKILSIKSHQSHEPFGDWKHKFGLFCTSSTMKWLEEDDATLPFHPSALAEASQGEDVRNLDLKS